MNSETRTIVNLGGTVESDKALTGVEGKGGEYIDERGRRCYR